MGKIKLTPTQKKIVDIGSLVFATIFWGFGFVAIELAMDNGWSSFSIIAFRGLIGGVLCIPFTIREKWWKDKKFMGLCLINGLVTFLAYYVQMEGQKRSSIPEASFMMSLEVIIVPFLCLIFRKTKITSQVIIAAIVSIVGLFIFTYQKGTSFSLFTYGNLLNLLTAALFGVQIMLLEPISKCDKPFSCSMLRLIVIGVVASIFMPLNGLGLGNFGDMKIGLISLIYVALFGSFAAFTLQTYGQKYVPSSTTSVVLSTQSFFGTIFAAIVFATPLTWQIGVGGVIIFASVLIACLDFSKILKRKKVS